jgi:hypothetical protein
LSGQRCRWPCCTRRTYLGSSLNARFG